MKPLRKYVVWRKGEYSIFNGWVKKEETELEGPVWLEESQGKYPIIKGEWGVQLKFV